MAKKAAQPRSASPKAKGKGKPKGRSGQASTGRAKALTRATITIPPPQGVDARVLDRLWSTILSRKDFDPEISHSARLLSRGTAKVAQKFGEEAVECLIEAVGGHRAALICESADVLYHLMVLWVDAGVRPEQIWNELTSREAMSGIAEKAARIRAASNTTKIP